MMQLKIKNCNNIENGEFDITEGRLNIKYIVSCLMKIVPTV